LNAWLRSAKSSAEKACDQAPDSPANPQREGALAVKILFIITTDDGESIYNAMRLANVGVEKGDEVSIFMLGKGVLFEKSGSEQFDVMGQMEKFKGDFYV
jgi:uncharacterized protein involved in oxidation of intracellular sulfur